METLSSASTGTVFGAEFGAVDGWVTSTFSDMDVLALVFVAVCFVSVSEQADNKNVDKSNVVKILRCFTVYTSFFIFIVPWKRLYDRILLENKERTVAFMATKTFITDVSFEAKDVDALIEVLENEKVPKRADVKEARDVSDKSEIKAMFSQQLKKIAYRCDCL